MEFLLEVGVDQVAAAVQQLGDRLAFGLQAKGYELMEQRTAENGAGIVAFRKEGVDAAEIVRKLRAAGIVVAPRVGWVRASPHFYISPEDIDKTLALLP